MSEDEFEELLTDMYPSVSICGYEWNAGEVLRRLDPIAFRCDFLDFLDSEGLEETE